MPREWRSNSVTPSAFLELLQQRRGRRLRGVDGGGRAPQVAVLIQRVQQHDLPALDAQRAEQARRGRFRIAHAWSISDTKNMIDNIRNDDWM